MVPPGLADEGTAGRCELAAPEPSPAWHDACSMSLHVGTPVEVAPGAVHVPGWLDLAGQARLLRSCRGWSGPPEQIPPTRLPRGGVMSVRTVCLGWHWYPYGYSRTVGGLPGGGGGGRGRGGGGGGGGGRPVLPFPEWLGDLGRRAVAEAYGDEEAAARYRPDVALVNFYDPGARMGMHRDRDERSAEPVVSVSLGDPCVFRFGNPERRGRPWQDLVLASGDLFVFGGPSRFAYHGVCRILPRAQELFGSDPSAGAGAAPEPGAVPDGGAAGMPALPSSTTRGRYNVTLRVSGLRP